MPFALARPSRPAPTRDILSQAGMFWIFKQSTVGYKAGFVQGLGLNATLSRVLSRQSLCGWYLFGAMRQLPMLVRCCSNIPLLVTLEVGFKACNK